MLDSASQSSNLINRRFVYLIATSRNKQKITGVKIENEIF